MSAIVELYVKKVWKGELNIEEVPTRWRAAVETELEKLNNENNE